MDNTINKYKEENENIWLKLVLCNRKLELSKQREIELSKQKELELLRMQKKLNYVIKNVNYIN